MGGGMFCTVQYTAQHRKVKKARINSSLYELYLTFYYSLCITAFPMSERIMDGISNSFPVTNTLCCRILRFISSCLCNAWTSYVKHKRGMKSLTYFVQLHKQCVLNFINTLQAFTRPYTKRSYPISLIGSELIRVYRHTQRRVQIFCVSATKPYACMAFMYSLLCGIVPEGHRPIMRIVRGLTRSVLYTVCYLSVCHLCAYNTIQQWRQSLWDRGDVSPQYLLWGTCLSMSPQYLGVFVLETSIFSHHLIARSPSVCSNKQRLTAAAAYFLSEKLQAELQWVVLHVQRLGHQMSQSESATAGQLQSQQAHSTDL